MPMPIGQEQRSSIDRHHLSSVMPHSRSVHPASDHSAYSIPMMPMRGSGGSSRRHPISNPSSFGNMNFLFLIVIIAVIVACTIILYVVTSTPQTQLMEAQQCCDEGKKLKGLADQGQITPTPPPASVPPSTMDASIRPPWLRVVIPTVSRGEGEDYLTPTIKALYSETVSSGLYSDRRTVQITVVNHNLPTHRHEPFEHLKRHVTLGEGSPWNLLNFVASMPKSRNANNRLLQQTQDFVWTIRHMWQQIAFDQFTLEALSSSYVLLMEDDFTLCPHGLRSLHYMIDKTTRYFPNWIGLRVSYGLNGVVIKNSDLPALIKFYESAIERHVSRREKLEPPDHMVYRFLYTLQQRQQGPNTRRQLVAYRYNLFRHIGVSSTFTGRKERYNPECYQILYDWLQPYERFRNEDCPNDDISPCIPETPSTTGPFSSALIDWDVQSKKLCRLHFPLCDKNSGVMTEEDAEEKACRKRG